jgi:hypothetical protein
MTNQDREASGASVLIFYDHTSFYKKERTGFLDSYFRITPPGDALMVTGLL